MTRKEKTKMRVIFQSIRDGLCQINYSYTRCVNCEENNWTREGIHQIATSLQKGEVIVNGPGPTNKVPY